MAIQRLNCWEYKKCGRELNGKNATKLGVCPASLDNSFDGINYGENGGRVCWAIAGTFCEGKTQGAFADKRNSCVKCDFFRMVNRQEGEQKKPTKILQYLVDTTNNSFLENLAYKRVKAGERFLFQGAMEDTAYIIQEGTCLTVVEKDGALHPTGHRGKGDIVGIRALFTGEPRHAHVEAETDMHLWVLNRRMIDNISKCNPELLTLLTEIVSCQFDSKRPVADREIGKYIATHIIGRGSYSIVYKAIHKDLNMNVAIKMMRHTMVIDSDFVSHFKKEAQIIASLNHENILNVYDFEERYKTVFIIMEYLEGESLHDLLSRLGTIPSPLAVEYISQICSGLSYAHHQGIIHRDINTLNVMVLPGDHIKIIDFGLACQLGTEDEHIGGALTYQAPELLEGESANECSDVYALGITAYELVTGKKPFTDREINKIFSQGLPRVIIDPAILIPDILPRLRTFILKACHHDKNLRYQKIDDAMQELFPLIDSQAKQGAAGDNRRQLTTIILQYDQKHQAALNCLLSEFSKKTSAIDVDLKRTDLSYS